MPARRGSWRRSGVRLSSDDLADAAGRALEHRVTLIDDKGVVVGDSEFDGDALRALENHSTRPEVAAAWRSRLGSARRVSASAGDEELYVAVRAPLGVARVSLPTRELEAVFARARRDVLLAGVVALLLAVILSLQFSRSISRPIVERCATSLAQSRTATSIAGRRSLHREKSGTWRPRCIDCRSS